MIAEVSKGLAVELEIILIDSFIFVYQNISKM